MKFFKEVEELVSGSVITGKIKNETVTIEKVLSKNIDLVINSRTLNELIEDLQDIQKHLIESNKPKGISNKFIVEADIKNTYTNALPTFHKGDNVEILFKITDEKKPFDISSSDFAKVEFTNRHGRKSTTICAFEILNGERVVKYNVVDEHMPTGYVEITLSIHEDERQVTVKPITILVLDK